MTEKHTIIRFQAFGFFSTVKLYKSNLLRSTSNGQAKMQPVCRIWDECSFYNAGKHSPQFTSSIGLLAQFCLFFFFIHNAILLFKNMQEDATLRQRENSWLELHCHVHRGNKRKHLQLNSFPGKGCSVKGVHSYGQLRVWSNHASIIGTLWAWVIVNKQ